MDKTALITGATGQDGSYLSELLLGKDYRVYGLIRRSSVNTTWRLTDCLNHPNFELIEGDVTDASCMHRLISNIHPDEVYNLAAMSNVGTSFDQPITTCYIDAIGPLNILEAIRQSSPISKFYQASTSELYGDTTISPQDENTPFNPNSPYAVAKLYAHQLVGLYRRAYGIFACAGILFNHEGPRRGEDFVTRKITKYVAGLKKWIRLNDREPKMEWIEQEYISGESARVILKCEIEPLKLGNINAKRDWSHAKDMVYGMWLILQQKEPDDYVLGSGNTYSVEQFLQLAFNYINCDYRDYVVVDSKLYRPADVGLLCANNAKARHILGWHSSISFSQLMEEMIDNDVRLLEGIDV